MISKEIWIISILCIEIIYVYKWCFDTKFKFGNHSVKVIFKLKSSPSIRSIKLKVTGYVNAEAPFGPNLGVGMDSILAPRLTSCRVII